MTKSKIQSAKGDYIFADFFCRLFLLISYNIFAMPSLAPWAHTCYIQLKNIEDLMNHLTVGSITKHDFEMHENLYTSLSISRMKLTIFLG